MKVQEQPQPLPQVTPTTEQVKQSVVENIGERTYRVERTILQTGLNVYRGNEEISQTELLCDVANMLQEMLEQ